MNAIAKRAFVYVCLTLLMGFATPAVLIQAQTDDSGLPQIKVVGNHFEDESGNTFVFRGLCFSDPNKLEKAGHWNRAYFEAAKSWHANVVRFPVHPGTWRERGQKAYLELLDQGIGWAKELGMYVIIDWHSIGNLRTELFTKYYYNTTKIETMRFWKAIAERYQGNSTVAFYELFNEPASNQDGLGRMSWHEHRLLMEDLIAAIRVHDQSTIPLVGGLDWAYDLSAVREEPIDFAGIAYVAHPYPQRRDAPWEDKWEADFGFVADTYPLVATEFGFMGRNEPGAYRPVIGDETYGEAILEYFDKKGISWTVWVFDPDWPPQLIKDWDFTPTRQGCFFKTKLTELDR